MASLARTWFHNFCMHDRDTVIQTEHRFDQVVNECIIRALLVLEAKKTLVLLAHPTDKWRTFMEAYATQNHAPMCGSISSMDLISKPSQIWTWSMQGYSSGSLIIRFFLTFFVFSEIICSNSYKNCFSSRPLQIRPNPDLVRNKYFFTELMFYSIMPHLQSRLNVCPQQHLESCQCQWRFIEGTIWGLENQNLNMQFLHYESCIWNYNDIIRKSTLHAWLEALCFTSTNLKYKRGWATPH